MVFLASSKWVTSLINSPLAFFVCCKLQEILRVSTVHAFAQHTKRRERKQVVKKDISNVGKRRIELLLEEKYLTLEKSSAACLLEKSMTQSYFCTIPTMNHEGF